MKRMSSVACVLVAMGICGGVLAGDARADGAPRRALLAQARPAATPARRDAATGSPAQAMSRRAAPVVPTEQAVLVHYQRIGRDLKQLQELRGTDCTLDLWPVFRAIKLAEATATADARVATAATLSELQLRIDRKRGITLDAECLNNPLAANCT